MTLVSFSYKNNVIATRLLPQQFTLRNCSTIRRLINLGIINTPKKWDSYSVTRTSPNTKPFYG